MIIGVMDEIIVIYGDDEMIVIRIIGDIIQFLVQQRIGDDHVENDIMYQVHENGVR
jgi:hypothetical protein